jgi:hypothetical protein
LLYHFTRFLAAWRAWAARILLNNDTCIIWIFFQIMLQSYHHCLTLQAKLLLYFQVSFSFVQNWLCNFTDIIAVNPSRIIPWDIKLYLTFRRICIFL